MRPTITRFRPVEITVPSVHRPHCRQRRTNANAHRGRSRPDVSSEPPIVSFLTFAVLVIVFVVAWNLIAAAVPHLLDMPGSVVNSATPIPIADAAQWMAGMRGH